ncbi:MAG TPA: DUF2158 domain-containing protein [Puia sp.]|nr:DUF2158 domain-containing protein [Puia sp.]
MSDKLRPGDIVQLKSGGPKMTLMYEDANENWVAEWFSGNDLKRAAFDAEMIVRVDETYKFAGYPNRRNQNHLTD